MSEKIPDGWVKSELGQLISEIGDGGTPSTSDPQNFGGGIPWVVIDDICPKIYKTQTTISERGLQKSSAKLWDKETVILSTGATIGRVGIAKTRLTTKQGICGIVTTDKLDSTYLYQYLLSITAKLNSLSQGSTIKETRPPTIKGMRFNLPPLPEQRKIASILTSVDEVIENTQKQIEKLQDLKKAVMNELLTRGVGHTEFKDSELGSIPREWQISPLGKCAVLARNQVLPSQAGDVPYIGLEHIQGNSLTLLGHGTTSDVASAKNKFSSGDILFAKLRPYLCKIILAPFEGICSTDIWVIRTKEVDQGFIYYTLTSQKFIEFSMSGSEGTRMPRAKWNHASQYKISFPPLPEQKKIVSILTSMDENIKEKQRKLHKTESLKKSLMQDLLTGRVRVKVN